MNFYSHHIGDYLSATAHLSLLEHGVYRRLIDTYYINESPLPLDLSKVNRLVGARSPAEKQAVEEILIEFFDRTESGWHQGRCEHEIALCNKNRINGSKGGRPPKNNNPNETQTKPSENREQSHPESPPSPHHPITPSEESTALSGKPDRVSSSKLKLNGHKTDAAEILAFLNTKTGGRFQEGAANIDLIAARLKDGSTVAECRQIIAKKYRDWHADENMAKYLRPKTLFNRTNFANYQGEIGTSNDPSDGMP